MFRKSYTAVLKFFETYYWFFFGAACLVLAFYCFRCLDVQYVDSWDEARHGVNAYEMIKNGDYIRHTYNYQVDDWNLKPSVSYWAIVLGFRIFGYGVFGLRFFSALAYLLTGVCTGLFARRYSKEASVLVLGFFCANTRPLSAHLARAGDADALYLLFFTLAMLAMFRIRENRKQVYVCGLMFSLAFLTKSWHAGMIAVIGFVYLLVSRELFRLRFREWAGFLGAVFGPLVFWFGWRFSRDGFFFLRQMIEVDLLARTGSGNFEGHQYPFSFYYDTVFGHEEFIYRWLILVCILGAAAGLALMIRKKAWNRKACEEGLGYLLWFLIPFLGFSLIRSKLIWYCYPCTVPLFLGAAIVLGYALRLPLVLPEGMQERRKGELVSAFAWITAAGCIFLTAHFMWNTYLTVIRGAKGNGFQLFVKESVERDSAYAGRRAYVTADNEKPENVGTWDQNMLFVAEIYGDFHCEDGGTEGFLREKRPAVLYLSRERYKECREELADMEVLYENEGYVLLGN
ncbi:MAG: phospholipid carrier-dependent glycosyltransferase [Lachnospiraceae bacterium]|nr:phospholipid carrier-dependent glycosyltransferase [Lachnospiraceae bacterium]